MKKRIFRFLLTGMFVMATAVVFSQDPPPPPGGGHGQSGNQTPGGSAPLGSGIALMLAMATAYGAKKVWDNRNKTDK